MKVGKGYKNAYRKDKVRVGEALNRKLNYYHRTKNRPYEGLFMRRVCRALEAELGIEKVEPKQYIYLRGIRRDLGVGKKLDFVGLAREAGYSKGVAEKKGRAILSSISDKLFEHVLGFGKKDVFMAITKALRQDKDLSSMLRAAELASKITGLTEAEGSVKLQINTGIKIAD